MTPRGPTGFTTLVDMRGQRELKQLGKQVLGRVARVTAGFLRAVETHRENGSHRAFTQMAALRKIQAATGLLPNYEQLLAHQYVQIVKSGQIAFDVGAHAGLHTRRLLASVGEAGRVVAFEPLPEQFRALQTEFGGRPNVELHQMALAAKSGTASFVHAVGTPEESGLRERIYNQPDLAKPTQIEVIVGRLDDVAAKFEHVDFIKIDIEGGEIDCLEGAKATLKRCRPVISVEYGFPSYSRYGHKAETLFDFAQANRYGVLDLFGNELGSRDDWLKFCDQAYWDYFLVPLERGDVSAQLTQG